MFNRHPGTRGAYRWREARRRTGHEATVPNRAAAAGLLTAATASRGQNNDDTTTYVNQELRVGLFYSRENSGFHCVNPDGPYTINDRTPGWVIHSASLAWFPFIYFRLIYMHPERCKCQ